jgi:hypothetical protein
MSINAQNTVESVKNKLIGKWVSSDRHITINYASNGAYTLCKDSVEVLKFDYQIDVVNDTIFIYFEDEGFKMKNCVFLNGNELIHANYKIGVGINDHIDEVYIFYKENVGIEAFYKGNEEKTKANFVLPADFRGEIMIAYDQKTSELSSTESVIHVPKSGLLKLKNKEDISKFIKRKFTFSYDNLNAPNGNKIEIIERDRVYTELELKKYDENTIFVLPLGFNQLGRFGVNEIFGESIVGNVEMYQVDVFKNLVKYLKN